MKPRSFQAHRFVGDAGCQHIARDVSGILKVMTEWSDRIFGCRGAMRVRDWTDCGITHWSGIKREQNVVADLVIVKCREFHK